MYYYFCLIPPYGKLILCVIVTASKYQGYIRIFLQSLHDANRERRSFFVDQCLRNVTFSLILVISSVGLCKANIRRFAHGGDRLSLSSRRIILFGMALRYRKTWSLKNIFIGSVAIDFISILLASLSHSIITVLLFGCLMNFFHGIIAGFYLFLLATKVSRQYRSLVFGGHMPWQVSHHGFFRCQLFKILSVRIMHLFSYRRSLTRYQS